MSCNERRKHLRSVVRQEAASKSEEKYVRTRDISKEDISWCVGMTVAFRERPRVRQTLGSFRGAGFPYPLLFCEPGANDLPLVGYKQIDNIEVRGNWGNFCHRAKWMVGVEATHYLFVQDDVDWLPESRYWLERNWPGNDGPVSLYRSAKYAVTNELPYSVLGYGEPFLGMLALALTRAMLLTLVANLEAMTDTVNKMDDVKFGQFCNALNIPINVVNASRCQHTGVVSSIYPTTGLSKLRQADTYVTK